MGRMGSSLATYYARQRAVALSRSCARLLPRFAAVLYPASCVLDHTQRRHETVRVADVRRRNEAQVADDAP
jgi:hypothetical protein